MHQEEQEPFLYTMEGGIAYSRQHIKAKIHVYEPSTKEYKGKLYLDLGYKRSEIEFTVERGNSANVDYVFFITALLPGLEPLSLSGKLSLTKKKSNADLTWKYGTANYAALVEYLQDEEQLFTGSIHINEVEYLGKFSVRDANIGKSINLELIGSIHFQLEALITKSYDSMFIDLSWDKTKNPTNRIFFRATIRDQSISSEFIASNLEGQFNLSYSYTSLDIDLVWGSYYIKAKGKLEISIKTVEVLVALRTSCEGLKEMRVHGKLHYERSLLRTEIDSRVRYLY